MSISAKTVKELRDKTGAGMMDCKRALSETDGDLEAATALLREKGLASAAKKSGRVAAEGMVGIFASDDGSAAVMVELNCETDFVAKNERFAELLDQVGTALLASGLEEGNGETASDVEVLPGVSMERHLTDAISSIGENIGLRRFVRVSTSDGVIGNYLHAGGKIGVLVDLKGAGADQLELARSLGMQVAAALPRYLVREDVPADVVSAEAEIFRNQALQSGKPEKVLDRIVTGKVDKFFGEICLMEQEYVRDSDLTIAKLLAKVGKEAGAELTVRSFVRYQLGEGIEKKQSNLAEEVAEQIAQGS